MNYMVSILIPLYNSEKYISETIQSCLNQTYQNIEIVIVDDGSTDNSYRIAKSYEADTIKVYQQKNSGACRARNYAFELSNGDYIQYLDADDLLSPNKIEEQIKLFDQFGNRIMTNCRWGRFSEGKESIKWEKQLLNRDYENPVEWLVDSWMDKGMAQTAVWLTPKHLIKRAGAWNEKLLINQDGDFFCQVLMHAQGIKFTDKCGVYYRSNLPDSITQKNKQSREKAESLLNSYKNYEQILTIQDSDTIREAIGNNYLRYIYQFDALFPDLSKEAKDSFSKLGLQKMWPIGGKWFKRASNIIGFKAALKIKKLFYSFIYNKNIDE